MILPTDQERLARIEEQITGVRDDISRVETGINSAVKVMSELHLHYVPRTEIEKQIELRDKQMEEHKKQTDALWKQVDRLKLWRSWLTGAVSALLGLSIILFEYLRQWVVLKP